MGHCTIIVIFGELSLLNLKSTPRMSNEEANEAGADVPRRHAAADASSLKPQRRRLMAGCTLSSSRHREVRYGLLPRSPSVTSTNNKSAILAGAPMCLPFQSNFFGAYMQIEDVLSQPSTLRFEISVMQNSSVCAARISKQF
jgi:hypothetical protein